MGVKPFRISERNCRGTERGELFGPAFEDRGALHEIEHAKAGRKPRRTRGRQHVVGTRDIIADCLGCVCPKKDRAGVADFLGIGIPARSNDLKMLRCDLINQRLGATDLPVWPEPDGRRKTSAAWLIERAGFGKGFGAPGPAALSDKHTLAVTNRGSAKAADVVALAQQIQAGVLSEFGIRLANEPVLVGIDL